MGVIDQRPVNEKRMMSILKFNVQILAASRGNVGIEVKRFIFWIERVNRAFELASQINNFFAAIQMQNAVDEIRHHFFGLQHLAECRTVAGIQKRLPLQNIRNYNLFALHALFSRKKKG